MRVCKMCLSHPLRHQHVSVAVATIIRVNYKNIMNPNNWQKA